jgi:hypothetical protein
MAEFKHSGNAGDIIYMLPTIAAIPGANVLYLNPNRPARYATGLTHPGGAVMLNEATTAMLIPLVEYCGIACKVWEGEEVDYDLDLFREAEINLSGYDIRRWIMAVYPELRPGPAFSYTPEIPEEGEPLRRYLTVNLSERYRQHAAGGGDKWELLNCLPYDVRFIGTEAEYHKFAALVPKSIHHNVSCFLDMADVIARGVYHFGNQSSPFAVAEIFDLPRALEISPYCPNVVSTGENWSVIYNRENLETILKTILP